MGDINSQEVETHLEIAKRIGIADERHVAGLLEQSESVGKLLRLLIRKIDAAE